MQCRNNPRFRHETDIITTKIIHYLIQVHPLEKESLEHHPPIRDWSLIRGGGATKWEKGRSESFCGPPSRQRKTFHAPLLNSGTFLCSPFTIAKTYSVKTTSKLVVPPFSMAKTFCAPLFIWVKLHMPPAPVV